MYYRVMIHRGLAESALPREKLRPLLKSLRSFNQLPSFHILAHSSATLFY